MIRRRRVLALFAGMALVGGALGPLGPAPAAADGVPVGGFGAGGLALLADGTLAPARRVLPVGLLDDDGGNVLVPAVSEADSGAVGGLLVRLGPDGRPDPGFGSGGVARLPDPPTAVAPLLDGRYLVATDATWVRLTAGGVVDPTFRAARPVDPVLALVPLPDGRTLVVGTAALVAVDGDGRVDGGFDATAALAAATVREIGTVGVAADGRVLLSTPTAADGRDQCRVVALDGRGQLDAGYGSGGVAVPAVAGVPLSACAVAVGADGTVAASWFDDGGLTAVVSVLDPAGRPWWQRTDRPVDAVGDGRIAFDGAGRLVEASPDLAGGFVNVRRLTREGGDDLGFGVGGVTSLAGVDDLVDPLVHVPDGGGVLVAGDLYRRGTGEHTGVWVAALDGGAGTAPEVPLRATTRFVPLAPTRVLDTRTGLGAPAVQPGAGGVVTLVVGGEAGVPADAVAVVLNVTATEAAGPGFVTVWPAGGRLPLVSNLNLERAGQTVANLVTVPLGAGGAVALYTLAPAHLLADVAGYYELAASARAGRFQPAPAPTRLLDTRTGVGAPAARPGAGAVVDLQVTGAGPVPVTGVAAVVLNVTGVDASAAGYVTVWPSGTLRPVASSLNLVAGDVRPNLVVVPVGADGRVSLYTQSGTHLLADVTGWFTDASAPDDVRGLFVPVPPRRMLDTRLVPAVPLAAGGALTRRIAGTAVVPPGLAGAVVANITITEPSAAGYVTAWPALVGRPLASNLNVVRDQTVANLAMVGLGGGSLALYSQSSAHLVVDVAGWFVA